MSRLVLALFASGLFASAPAFAQNQETPPPTNAAANQPTASPPNATAPPVPVPKEQPPAPTTAHPPPPPRAQPIEPPQVATAPQPLPAPPPSPAVVPAPPPGQWVYTTQYGWLWMPYEQAYTYVNPDAALSYMFVFYPRFGWRWVVAPWVLGFGPAPFWGAHGPAHFVWYMRPFRIGVPYRGPGWGRVPRGGRGPATHGRGHR
jgi:hypothetical protein